jgi:hypothetical protein
MRCALAIVSYKGDLHWLSYCLRFLTRNWKEPGTPIFVRLEHDCRETVETWKVPQVHYSFVDPWPDGYQRHMFLKLTWDYVIGEEFDLVIMIDSDLMLTEPCFLADLVDGQGKPVIDWLDWHDSPQAEKAWRGCTSRAMGMDLDRDYMCSAPLVYRRETIPLTRLHIEKVTGQPLEQFMYSSTPFRTENFHAHPMKLADYEALGLYAAKYQSDKYALRSCHERPVPWPWRLYWSRGDWNETLQSYFAHRLGTY